MHLRSAKDPYEEFANTKLRAAKADRESARRMRKRRESDAKVAFEDWALRGFTCFGLTSGLARAFAQALGTAGMKLQEGFLLSQTLAVHKTSRGPASSRRKLVDLALCLFHSAISLSFFVYAMCLCNAPLHGDHES